MQNRGSLFEHLWQPLQKLWRAGPSRRPAPSLPQATPPLCFVPDLHGRQDLLEVLFAEIRNRDPEGRARVIFLGDLVDRGPHSAEVLEDVHAFCSQDPQHRLCLMGNHERMMLDFIDNPLRNPGRWLRVGGQETLASYGISARHSRDPRDELLRLSHTLGQVVPPQTLSWLRQLPLYWQDESLGILAAHAGTDPQKPLAKQGEAEFLWGKRLQLRQARKGMIEVQGHVVVESARFEAGRIWLDTGAYRTGQLSVLWLDQEAHWLSLTAQSPTA